MGVEIREVRARSVLSRSRIPGADFCINPYVGCSHACKYCYATFMARYSQHVSPWGTFVDAKINAPEVLEEQLRRGARGAIMISSVTDAYQPLEARYRLTRRCLEKLRGHSVLVDILTKSPLVVRDIEILKQLGDAS
ncbi:MAG: radical SAM protein, partial [Thermodesulfovibrionales bacterium]